MAYPTIEQYQEALQHPATAFIDPVLSKGKIRASGLGTPLVASGGFALTYGLEISSKKYAVRCFHREAKGLENRYAAISKKLQSLSSEYFVEFEYQATGVRIGKATWPIVKMAWASGETLGEFVENNYRDKTKLTNLINSLNALSEYLEKSGIAHGDIQDGNLMVADGGRRLQLIDYDGMYVPELASLGSAELGHRDYQHPKRDNTVYDAHLDRFSFISINLALRALIEKQDVWHSSQSGAGVIVFKANDFAAPYSSKVFAEIKNIPSLKQAAENFSSICIASYSQIPLLADFISGTNIPKVAIPQATVATSSQNNPVSYISQYPVIRATDYYAFQKNVGQMVELIGQIQHVKAGENKYGKPFIFINFTDWRRNGVKINIWNNAIEHGGIIPNESWIGKWVTIKGLVEPPFTSPKVNAAHIAITANALSQITRLTEEEAKYRLGEVTVHSGVENSVGSNAALLKLMGVKATNGMRVHRVNAPIKPLPNSTLTAPTTQTALSSGANGNLGVTPSPPKSSNQLALEALRNSAGKSLPINHSSSNRQSPAWTSSQPSQYSSPNKSSDTNWFTIIMWIIGAVLVLRACAK